MAEKNPRMPYAVPGVGECTICFEVVPFVKVLSCQHSLCLPCATKLVQESEQSLLNCPECRQPTDCSHGLGFLKTRYFGKISCDICLEKKPVEDVWWCGNCFQALCSKCSIKEHAHKKHTMSEWNKMEPVQFSVNYLNEAQFKRQNSTGSEVNKKAVRMFLDAVEKELHKQISLQAELTNLRDRLLSKYGTQFSTDSNSSGSGISESTEGPRVVAKVLQLAGTEIMDAVIPSISEQLFQIYFSITPDEVASFLRSKIEYIPYEQSSDKSESGAAASAPPSIQEQVVTRMQGSKAAVLGLDYSPTNNIVVLRLAAEVQLYNLNTKQQHVIPVAMKQQTIRSVCLTPNGELLVALQSTVKRYDWSLEAYGVSQFPISSCYTADFDIDPEDAVESLILAVNSPGSNVIYELRLCVNSVAEIWKATPTSKSKKGKVKLKESLLYQRGDARYTDLRVIEPSQGKDKYLFVWDELSSCLHRLIVRDGRCELDTKVLHSAVPAPFCIDSKFRIWLFDPHLCQICVSNDTVLKRANITFKQVYEFTKHPFLRLAIFGDSIIGVQVNGADICLVTFMNC